MKDDFDKKLNEMSEKYKLAEEKTQLKEKDNAIAGYFLGISLISHTLVGLFLGYWVDQFFNSTPFAFLFFMFLGFFSGFRHIWLNIK